jgi:hypothetical protein
MNRSKEKINTKKGKCNCVEIICKIIIVFMDKDAVLLTDINNYA